MTLAIIALLLVVGSLFFLMFGDIPDSWVKE